jgi:hypothetical protein
MQGFGVADADGAEVAAAVLGYLASHPHAADTLHGITAWWLPRQRYEVECERIERVLEHLVESGALRHEQLPDGALLYALPGSPAASETSAPAPPPKTDGATAR